MAKVFRYFFHKKDYKDGGNIPQSNKEDTRGIIHVQAGRDEMVKRYGARKYKVQRRTSDSISNDPVYLNKLFGLNNKGTVRLFSEPTEEEHYFPDGPKYTKKEKNPRYPVNRQNINNMQVYTASVTRNSSVFNPPSSSRPSEPFPYKVYDSPPRRSTMHYGVDSEGKPLHSDEYPQLSISKGIDGYSVPSNSPSDGFNHSDLQYTQDNKERLEQGRRVTIVAPNEMGDISLMNDHENETNDLQTKPVRTTVLRFRPHSSASRNSRESVKLMVCRADQIEHPPMVLSRHVHQFPLKKIRHTPVLMTDDGRVLKPLDINKQTKNSLSINKEESRVRLSMADIENICKPPRKSTEIIHPVLHSQNNINRNSIRQSLISRKIGNEGRSSILRESREEPKMSYRYSLEETKPVVYGVPVIPSRNRTNSQLSRQSVVSYNERLDNGGIQYYEDERKPIDKELRYSRGSYQPDRIIIKKDKPIVVYEVHNPQNNNRSFSKNSTIKNEKVYTKPQQNSVEESVVTNQNTDPLLQIIYQEPKSPLQPNQNIKEKHSFVNETKIRKTSENYMKDFNLIHQQQPVVYVAKVPSRTLFAPNPELRKCTFKKKLSGTCSTKEKVQSKDFCGLTCEPQEKTEPIKQQINSNLKMVSSSQQTDFENDVDFLCYPAENLYKTTTNFPESDSKLKWRIIIKKQQNK